MILFIHGRIGLYFDFDGPRDEAVFIESPADENISTISLFETKQLIYYLLRIVDKIHSVEQVY